jgi:hypothetical protein
MTPKEVERFAESEGVTTIGRITLLVKVFGLSLTEAKAFLVSEDGSLEALPRYQKTLIEPIMMALDEFERETDS